MQMQFHSFIFTLGPHLCLSQPLSREAGTAAESLAWVLLFGLFDKQASKLAKWPKSANGVVSQFFFCFFADMAVW
jgi:hypothetical protein